MIVRVVALALSIWSHGAAAGEPSDRCFTARAKWFEKYLRAAPSPDRSDVMGGSDG